MLVTYALMNDEKAWEDNTVNNETFHVKVIPADNARTLLVTGENESEYELGLKGDTYPYGANNELTDTSTPSTSDLLYGRYGTLGKPVTDIVYDEATQRVSFDFMGGSDDHVITAIADVQVGVDGGTGVWYRMDGIQVDKPAGKGLYLYRGADGRMAKKLMR